MVDKIVGVTDDGEYVAIESDSTRDYFSMTGCTGRIMSEAQLDRAHEDWKNDTDFESEYDYLYGESHTELSADEYVDDAEKELYPDGLPEAEDELEEARERIDERAQELADEAMAEDRKEFFEGLADDFEWPHPFEINYELSSGDLYATVESCGQIDRPETVMPVGVTRDDLDFLFKVWKEWNLKPLKEVPSDVVERVHRILDGIDPEEAIKTAAAELGVSVEASSGDEEPEYERPSGEEFRKTHPKEKTEFTFDPMMQRRPEVRVKSHRRRVS